MDCRIFNMRTDVNVCNCTRGCTHTIRESALKVDSGRKIPLHRGIKPRWVACRSNTLPTELHPHLYLIHLWQSPWCYVHLSMCGSKQIVNHKSNLQSHNEINIHFQKNNLFFTQDKTCFDVILYKQNMTTAKRKPLGTHTHNTWW